MTARTISQARLKEVLNYDPDTGVFTWIKKPSPRSNRVIIGSVAGYVLPNKYRVIGIDGINHKAHRLALLYMNGKLPEDQGDHENHSRDDNRIENIRDVSKSENAKNTSQYKNNTSGITGVYFDKNVSKWRAFISINGKVTYLGIFKCITAASITRKAAEIKYGFHPNHGN